MMKVWSPICLLEVCQHVEMETLEAYRTCNNIEAGVLDAYCKCQDMGFWRLVVGVGDLENVLKPLRLLNL